MKWIGQHIYDLVARFRNDVYLEDLSTTTETNVLVVDSTGKVSKTTVITGDVTGVTAGSNITVTDPTGPVPTVALSTNVDVAGTLDVTSLGTFDASVTVAGKISLKDAGDSIFVGYEAGLNDDASANLNVGVGYQALRANTTGANNSAHGYRALYSNTTGANNTATGLNALYSNTTGINNTATGLLALRFNTTGTGNAALGYAALYENTTGGSNTAIGREAGRFIADGTTANTSTSNSVFLGYNTKALADSQTNQIVIGDTAVGLGSNTAILGNSSITKTQLQGNVGIGTASPVGKLEVQTVDANRYIRFKAPNGEERFQFYTGGTGNYASQFMYDADGTTRNVQIAAGGTSYFNGGNVGIGNTNPQNKLDIVGSLGRGAPVTKTTDFTVAATENWLIMNGTATITITLPTASSFTGRELMIKNIAAYTVISASSNVKPIDTNTAATAILPATAGSWCTLVSDGTNWVTMMN
jgi:hypothetical protein